MAITIKDGILNIPGAQNKLRKKGHEIPSFLDNYTLLDIETTGLSPIYNRITELGGIKVRNGQIVDKYTNLVKFPDSNKVPAFLTKMNGISEDLINEKGIPVEVAAEQFRDFIGSDIIIGYNVNFDLNFLYDLMKKYKLPLLTNNYVDVLRFARVFYPRQHNRLIDVMQRAGIAQVEQHRGLDDSIDTKKVYDDFKANFTDEMLQQVQNKIKNVDLTSNDVDITQLGFRNPVNAKNIVLTGNLQMNQKDGAKMITNLGGNLQDSPLVNTNYLIMGDHDFFKKDNQELNEARSLIKNGAKIKRLSETFFVNMLDDWARS